MTIKEYPSKKYTLEEIKAATKRYDASKVEISFGGQKISCDFFSIEYDEDREEWFDRIWAKHRKARDAAFSRGADDNADAMAYSLHNRGAW